MGRFSIKNVKCNLQEITLSYLLNACCYGLNDAGCVCFDFLMNM